MPAIETLIQDLQSYQTRPAAMNQLRSLGDAAGSGLIAALGHHIEGVRWAATHLLGEIGAPDAIQALEKYVDDTRTGFQAAESIEAIRVRCGIEAAPDATAAEQTAAQAESTLQDDELMKRVVDGTSWAMSAGPEGYTVTVDLPGGRSQRVQCIFQPLQAKGTPLVLIYTGCGPSKPELYEAALKLNAKLPFGAVGLREVGGDLLFVMVNSFIRETVSVKDIKKSVSRLAKEADALEKQLAPGQDTL